MSGLASVLHEKELATLKKMLIFCKARGWERDDMLNFWELLKEYRKIFCQYVFEEKFEYQEKEI